MKCLICRHSETEPGRTTLTLEREGVTLLVRGVEAQLCGECGEAYVPSEVTARLLEAAEQVVRAARHEAATARPFDKSG